MKGIREWTTQEWGYTKYWWSNDHAKTYHHQQHQPQIGHCREALTQSGTETGHDRSRPHWAPVWTGNKNLIHRNVTSEHVLLMKRRSPWDRKVQSLSCFFFFQSFLPKITIFLPKQSTPPLNDHRTCVVRLWRRHTDLDKCTCVWQKIKRMSMLSFVVYAYACSHSPWWSLSVAVATQCHPQPVRISPHTWDDDVMWHRHGCPNLPPHKARFGFTRLVKTTQFAMALFIIHTLTKLRPAGSDPGAVCQKFFFWKLVFPWVDLALL